MVFFYFITGLVTTSSFILLLEATINKTKELLNVTIFNKSLAEETIT